MLISSNLLLDISDLMPVDLSDPTPTEARSGPDSFPQGSRIETPAWRRDCAALPKQSLGGVVDKPWRRITPNTPIVGILPARIFISQTA